MPPEAEVMTEKDQIETTGTQPDSLREPGDSAFPLGWMMGEVGQSLKPEDVDRVFGSVFGLKGRSRETTNGF